jgi:hypothetical protein
MPRLIISRSTVGRRQRCGSGIPSRSISIFSAVWPLIPKALPARPPYLAGAERHAAGMHMRLPSAAGHDAAVLSYRMPAGMMFIPSLGGVSHHW